MIGSTKHQDAVTQVLGCLQRFRLSLNDLGGEDLRASNPRRREKMRRVERAWALMARLGVAYADLEDAEPLLPAKLNRRRRSVRVFPQPLKTRKNLENPSALKSLKNFPSRSFALPESPATPINTPMVSPPAPSGQPRRSKVAMAQRISGYARQRDDEYETPAWVARVVVPYLRHHCRYVWDPANGPASKIASVLRDEGFDAIATNDNFLARTSIPDTDVDDICTNPPYGFGGRLACQFIAHALELVPVVAMLLRIDFDSGKTRTHLFRDCVAFDSKIVLLERIVCFEREDAPGPSENHSWYVWNRRHQGPPTISYAGRPR